MNLPIRFAMAVAVAASCILTPFSPRAAHAQSGFKIQDATSVQHAVDQIRAALQANGNTIIAVVNHAAAAAGVGLSLRPTQLILFTNQRTDSLLVRRSGTAGIDLPNKFLVWEDADGQIHLDSNAPSYLADRHGITIADFAIQTLQETLGQFDDDTGLVVVKSAKTVDDSVAAIRAAIAGAGLNSLLIDHERVMQGSGPSIDAMRLILFGNPLVGTPLMQNRQSIGIDLPLKILVWEHRNEVFIAYNDPKFLARRHGVEGFANILNGMTNTLRNLANVGAAPGN